MVSDLLFTHKVTLANVYSGYSRQIDCIGLIKTHEIFGALKRILFFLMVTKCYVVTFSIIFEIQKARNLKCKLILP